MPAFERVARKVFEEKMVDHVREHLPVDFQLLGENQTRAVVQRSMARAEGHGITAKSDTCRYITFVFLLGSDFDLDPQLPWAKSALAPERGSAPARMQALRTRTLDYLQRIAGPSGKLYRRALYRVRTVSFEERCREEGGFEACCRALLSEVHPEKYAEIEGGAMATLLVHAAHGAERDGMTSPAGRLLYATLMFLMGSGFASDPLYPWAAALLGDSSLADPDEKAQALHGRAVAHLEQALALGRAREGG